jgi:hypothetical protein
MAYVKGGVPPEGESTHRPVRMRGGRHIVRPPAHEDRSELERASEWNAHTD